MASIGLMVVRLAGALESMLTSSGAPVGGSMLDDVVSGRDPEGAALQRYVEDLFEVDDATAEAVLRRFSEVMEMGADVALLTDEDEY